MNLDTDLTHTGNGRVEFYIEQIRQNNAEKQNKYGKQPLAYVRTFGCQMNAHDSERIEGMLYAMGYARAEDEKDADVVLYNTCCVRENAENKVYGNLGFLKHLKQQNKDLKIVLCGCMMQQDVVVEKLSRSYRYVDIIFGTFNIHKLPELLYTSIESGRQIIDIWKENRDDESELPEARHFKYKASVNIMYGCDNFCSYCIVPYVRGRERSRRLGDIMREIRGLADDGVKEIMLLGQNVNSYGLKGREGEGRESEVDFASLLRAANEIDGIERIRFMTSHPKDLSGDVIEAVAGCEKVCKHIHLPMQSGSTEILRRMNRKYTRDDYLSLIERIRAHIPEIAITSDIIVGFPGETETDFLHTLDAVKTARFSGAFLFLYSIRTGTPAAVMADQVPESIANERFQRLNALFNDMLFTGNSAFIGKTLKVLAEGTSNGMLTGRADNNSIVHFTGNMDIIGTITDVKINDCKTFYLMGEQVNG